MNLNGKTQNTASSKKHVKTKKQLFIIFPKTCQEATSKRLRKDSKYKLQSPSETRQTRKQKEQQLRAWPNEPEDQREHPGQDPE
jgi:hypothetical protein